MMSPEVQAMMAQMGMAGMSGGNAAMSGGNATDVSSAQIPHITLLDDQQKRELPVATAQIAQTKRKGGSGAGGAMLQGFASQALSFAAMGAGPAGMVAMPIMGMAGGLVPGMHHGTPSMTYIWALPGRQSSTLVLSSTPKFDISFADIVGIDPDQYEPTIVRLVQSKDNWRLVGASKVKMTEMAQGYPESQIAEERLPARLNKLSLGHAELEPQKPLDAGEYAVVLHPLHKKKKGSLGGGSEAQVFYSVWDFSVPAQTNNAANKKP